MQDWTSNDGLLPPFLRDNGSITWGKSWRKRLWWFVQQILSHRNSIVTVLSQAHLELEPSLGLPTYGLCIIVITLSTLQSTFHIRCKFVKDTSLINSCIARWHAPIIPVLGRWKQERVKGHPWLHYKFNTSGVTLDSAVTEQVAHICYCRT